MEHADHVRLISKAIPKGPGVWADLGSGDGAFTLALRDLGGENIEIYSVDKDKKSLEIQEREFADKFPQSNIHFIEADFTNPLELPLLDGILMANSLHYMENHVSFLQSLRGYLKPNGKLVLVEYNVDSGNQWVPYPLTYENFREDADEAGFEKTELLDTIPSQFLREIYSAQAML